MTMGATAPTTASPHTANGPSGSAVSHQVERRLSDRKIVESSGLARSTYPRPMLWTHNDSGDTNRVFAVNKKGRTRAVVRLGGARARDWEDISSGPGHRIWVGDVGDNARRRSAVQVYRFTEPRKIPRKGRTVKVTSTRFNFTYPDRAHDAESILVHPRTGRLYIVTKAQQGAGVYAAPAKLSNSSPNKLTRIADAPANITAGSFSPDGKTIILGSYTQAFVYSSFTDTPSVVNLPKRSLGESLEVNRAGTGVLLGSEGVKSPVLRIAMPAPSSAAAPPTSGCTPSSSWTPDLTEEFTGLDPNVWNVKNDTYASNEDSYLRSRNVSVTNGRLRIQARKETYRSRNFTSGYVETIGKYTLPSYFRAEVRAKVPLEQGMWAAPLWLRPVDGKAGEIDLVETYGRDAQAGRASVHHTIHTEYGSTHKQSVRSKRFSELPGSATGWHTYTMEKTPGKIVMWVDCVKTAEYTNANPSWYSAYYDVGDRWNLRINLQLGGQWGGLPDSTTDWSPDKTAMEVDYVRTWVPRS